MTVTGRVLADGAAVGGATVTIAELRASSRTNEDGRYSFIVRASDVRGQSVTLVARHRRYGTQSVRITLEGRPIEQDIRFALGAPERETRPDRRADTTASARPLATIGTGVDSSVFAEAAGPADFVGMLAGRLPGLVVTSAAVLGGSSTMMFRGPRSVAGDNQPLVVVDGIPVHASSFATPSQRFGLGGFDYGSPLGDLALADIGTVSLLTGPEAILRFGARAANGVLVVATKRGGALSGLHISANTRFTVEDASRLPSYQNEYGQGLGGQFEFFDGSGGGVNDDVEQSWGPRLEGQPIIQASLTEPRRPEVRAWLPQPSAIRDYFSGARTLDATVALDGGYSAAGFRIALDARSAQGLTPGATQRRLGMTLSGSARPTDRLAAEGNVRIVRNEAADRPGTGFDEINPVSGFTRMGRQVDLAALGARIKDSVEQINWIYTTRNNPFFQSVENSNDDHRGHIIASGTARYRVADWLTAALFGGTDNYHESRNFQVAPGWKGGYPTALGRGDFSGGGSQREKFSVAERLGAVSLDATGPPVGGWNVAGTAGLDIRKDIFETSVAIRDSTTGSPAVTAASLESDDYVVTSMYAAGSLSRADVLFLNAGLRREQGGSLPIAGAAPLFPFLAIAYDAAARFATVRRGLHVDAARLRAGWWRAGNEVTARSLATTYVRRGSLTAPTVGVRLDELNGPERTTGLEIGAELAGAGGRMVLDVGWYRERSSQVIAPLVLPANDSAGQTAAMSNTGFELQLSAVPFRDPAGLSWDIAFSFAQNRNRVDRIAPGVDEIPLGPSHWGASLLARVGQPLGLIAGGRFLRDPATRALILRNGLPIPDEDAGITTFGSWQPDWTGAAGSTIRYRAVEMSFLLDARVGGKVFSATNLWGSYAGTLSSTLVGRDTGLVVAGLDSLTGAANTTRVSAEDYFHSLAPIHEAWIFDASYTRLREARLTVELPLTFVPTLRQTTGRLSIVGRNLLVRSNAPNLDPEAALSAGVFQGFEMGQLPNSRSVGVAVTITP